MTHQKKRLWDEENEIVFKTREFDRIALCETLFSFVKTFAKNVKDKDYEELLVTRSVEQNSCMLPARTAKLFGHLRIAAIGNHETNVVVIILSAVKLANDERGGKLLESMIQGIKMGMLFASSIDPDLDIKFCTELPSDNITLRIFKNVEGLATDVSKVFRLDMVLTKVLREKGPLWFWTMICKHFPDEQVEDRVVNLNGRALISCCSMVFCGEGIVANECVNYVFEDIIEGNLLSSANLTDKSPVTQAIFENLSIRFDKEQCAGCEEKISIHISMTYKEPFRCLDLMPRLMGLVLQKHSRVFQEKGMMPWSSVTVEQTNPRGKHAVREMTHDFLLYDDDIMMCGLCFRVMSMP
jgi:hypothetical protein